MNIFEFIDLWSFELPVSHTLITWRCTFFFCLHSSLNVSAAVERNNNDEMILSLKARKKDEAMSFGSSSFSHRFGFPSNSRILVVVQYNETGKSVPAELIKWNYE